MGKVELGIALLTARAKKDLTQKEVAQKLNITVQSLVSWEKGKKVPSLKALIKLADFYDLKAEKLIKLREDSKN